MLHSNLPGGKWLKLDLIQQMANIGSEVERAISWKKKGNHSYAHQANTRALELFDLTLSDVKHPFSSLKEIARARELWLDFFVGANQYHQTVDQWQRYFRAFNLFARNPHRSISPVERWSA